MSLNDIGIGKIRSFIGVVYGLGRVRERGGFRNRLYRIE